MLVQNPPFKSLAAAASCLWHFEGVVLIMLDKLCVLMVLATIFQLNLGAKESGNTLMFRLAQKKKDLVVSTKSSRVL